MRLLARVNMGWLRVTTAHRRKEVRVLLSLSGESRCCYWAE
jgi:hypothetical protein